MASTDALSPSRQPQAKATEADFLNRQVEDAKQAISRTLHEMADSLKDAGDVRAWASEYPWASVGAAAALGFLVASAVTPSRDETLSQRLHSLRPEAPPPPAAAPAPAAPQKPSTLSTVLAPLADAVKTALIGTLSSALTAKAQEQTEEYGGRPYSAPAHGPTEPL